MQNRWALNNHNSFQVNFTHVFFFVSAFRFLIIHPFQFAMPKVKITFSGKMSELKQNFGANQWNFNLLVGFSIFSVKILKIFKGKRSFTKHATLGVANVLLPKSGERYHWNKVTTCVHNLFSGQRWVDQYGELKIVSSLGIICKLTFVKVINSFLIFKSPRN